MDATNNETRTSSALRTLIAIAGIGLGIWIYFNYVTNFFPTPRSLQEIQSPRWISGLRNAALVLSIAVSTNLSLFAFGLLQRLNGKSHS
jgi:hypothetical protein